MKVNILAGRKDSALAVGMKIIECYDSALTSQKEPLPQRCRAQRRPHYAMYETIVK